MGLFTTNQTNTANSVYEETKKYLKEKNGNVHILMINSFSKLGNQVFGCEDKYTYIIVFINNVSLPLTFHLL